MNMITLLSPINCVKFCDDNCYLFTLIQPENYPSLCCYYRNAFGRKALWPTFRVILSFGPVNTYRFLLNIYVTNSRHLKRAGRHNVRNVHLIKTNSGSSNRKIYNNQSVWLLGTYFCCGRWKRKILLKGEGKCSLCLLCPVRSNGSPQFTLLFIS